MIKCGIVGLPNAGKSTLFNALACAQAQVGPYPFTTIQPNLGVVEVPDERLSRLAQMFKAKKVTATHIQFVDIAGLVKDAHKGEGLGNQFLGHIREVDLIVMVLRCFEDANVSHTSLQIDPLQDREIIKLELVFADLQMIERGLEKKLKDDQKEKLLKLKEMLEREENIKEIDEEILPGYSFLSNKPVIYAANTDREDSSYLEKLSCLSPLISLNAKFEMELSCLAGEERKEFLQGEESGLNKLVDTCYKLLDYITFFTVKGEETRAWTLKKGMPAVKAAARVHTDMEKGFIKAEVINYENLAKFTTLAEAREKGEIRLEGRDYPVKDGDILYFHFH